ncbi:hypothetical protein Pmani_036444 [Petrolisthes manimaculis]|uniref:G-protein coupled receptors family 1 profile domain-containing protein n=1 Tax=Petrolisthes manimaculis TaxID=1843537 RepID=A0AAE1NBX7_9EUCA|nr:hypothetical protein Pmani_039913 [Petrolisthes manimaculis]KAK4290673.1 hypothetical protein Pmani_036444 [Petrolisthes manimaculis]
MESLEGLTPYDLSLNVSHMRHHEALLFNLTSTSDTDQFMVEEPFGLDSLNNTNTNTIISSNNEGGLFPYALNDSLDPLTANGTDPNKYNLPWWHELIWYVVFMGMVIVATGGNLIVIWIVLADRRMRTVTNIFLVNLSVADAMVSTLNVVFNFTYMLNLHWRFGLVYCKISQFVSILSICASVFTLMAISFDR